MIMILILSIFKGMTMTEKLSTNLIESSKSGFDLEPNFVIISFQALLQKIMCYS